jgi:hypothetical protein
MRRRRVLSNPYYERWRQAQRNPDFLAKVPLRDDLVKQYAWAVPSPEALTLIASYSPLVEMGGGTGYWAGLLAALGADILCYDSHPSARDGQVPNRFHGLQRLYFPVQRGRPPVLAEHAGRTLFLCWPPYQSSMATRCLTHWRGRTLIYIGEVDGCTASPSFESRLDREFVQEPLADGRRYLKLPQWLGCHDVLRVFRRRRCRVRV